MTVRVGVIGTGLIGTDHANRLVTVVSGATVSAVTDIDRGRAEQVAERIGGARVSSDGHELIASDEVDAVLVSSIPETHAEFTLAAIAAGKPVLCEKPLAPTTRECERILEAEAQGGKRLVTVGFMRRHDAGYREIKSSLDEDTIGEALVLHHVHRNRSVPDTFTSFMAITASMVHEIDVTRWLVGEEISFVQVLPPKRTSKAAPQLQDPQFAVFTTESGLLATAELFVNCQYGYDVRCEIVGELGTASLVDPLVASHSVAGQRIETVASDWRLRFGPAYAAELQAWISGLGRGEVIGPSAWDGYAATRVTEAGVEAVRTGERVSIDYVAKPGLYS
jgi:myo-inositol 2-dehydrogenase / D-chiro-inositol 1-dehydrogenase